MINANDLRKGIVFLLDSAPCIVIDVSFQSPTARGGTTLVKTKYRNLITGQVLNSSFKAGDKMDEADFARRKGQFLYAMGDQGVFMDQENYEQYEISGDLYDEIKGYLLENGEVSLGVFNDQVVTLELPQVVELIVTETAPAIRNATATAQTKEAILETGISVQVPGYLESGEKIKIDTRDGRFVSRA
ncbi:translation initiation factor 5A precursor (eIF-5A) [Desulfuromusa kysingii]|uniref:Elongation factor P n=1 Tax=Desulfuromusa kysingii TaxID=37625 RepID=A0A1H3XA28_9BACT|nr:elongation factor P [Desulfuromusa kysingii]SDZ95418.1 translation initiation factor 5A precursor (eIF-5A) [Desulfuromusa kysingii]